MSFITKLFKSPAHQNAENLKKKEEEEKERKYAKIEQRNKLLELDESKRELARLVKKQNENLSQVNRYRPTLEAAKLQYLKFKQKYEKWENNLSNDHELISQLYNQIKELSPNYQAPSIILEVEKLFENQESDNDIDYQPKIKKISDKKSIQKTTGAPKTTVDAPKTTGETTYAKNDMKDEEEDDDLKMNKENEKDLSLDVEKKTADSTKTEEIGNVKKDENNNKKKNEKKNENENKKKDTKTSPGRKKRKDLETTVKAPQLKKRKLNSTDPIVIDDESDNEKQKNNENSEANKWRCPRCTFANPTDEKQCVMCYGPMPKLLMNTKKRK